MELYYVLCQIKWREKGKKEEGQADRQTEAKREKIRINLQKNQDPDHVK